MRVPRLNRVLSLRHVPRTNLILRQKTVRSYTFGRLLMPHIDSGALQVLPYQLFVSTNNRFVELTGNYHGQTNIIRWAISGKEVEVALRFFQLPFDLRRTSQTKAILTTYCAVMVRSLFVQGLFADSHDGKLNATVVRKEYIIPNYGVKSVVKKTQTRT